MIHEYRRNVDPEISNAEDLVDASSYFHTLYEESMGEFEIANVEVLIGDKIEDYVTPKEFFKACPECPDDFYWPQKNHVCLFVVHEARVLCGQTSISPSCLEKDSSNNCYQCQKLFVSKKESNIKQINAPKPVALNKKHKVEKDDDNNPEGALKRKRSRLARASEIKASLFCEYCK